MARISIVIVSAFLLLLAAASAQAQPCTCVDVGDIKARMAEANAANAAYAAEMQKMVEQITRTRDPIPYTPERREKLQSRVQDAVNKVAAGRISPTPSIKGENPGGTSNTCSVTINLSPSATACMKESVKRHEDHHQRECRKTLSAGKVLGGVVTGKVDRFERDGAQLIQYAQEEIGGYTTEMMFLQSELTRLAQAEECKPKPPQRRDYTAQPRAPK
ncbi:MAG: hypothetical protein ABI671_12630 [Burkholderiales bacterium]